MGLPKAHSLPCDKCGSINLRVIDSRGAKNEAVGDMIYRRRKCLDCGHKMSYYEIEAGSLYDLLVKSMTLKTIKSMVEGGKA